MQIDDSDRMIQEILSELGYHEELKTFANKIKRQHLTRQHALAL